MSGSIYVDFDDVLCETAKDLMRLLEREHGKRVAYEEIRCFDLGVSFGLTREELRGFLDAAHRPEVIRAIPPVPGAGPVLKEWMDAGFEVVVVTGRPPETEAASREWLAEHGVPCSRLVFVDKYGRASGDGVVTLEDLSRMRFRLAIDDAPAMLDFLVSRMSMPVIVFDRPWNVRGVSDPPLGRTLLRCADWDEIRERAETLLGGAGDA